MKTVKAFLLIATSATIALVPLALGTLRAAPTRPNPHKPVWATDLVLGKKVTLKGGPVRASGNRQLRMGAATGFLGAPCNGAKYAVVVGISNYPGVSNDLAYAAADANTIAEVLTTTYGFSAGNIALLMDQEATRANILDAIDAIRSVAGPEDEVVFTFSGHGMSGVADDGDAERVDEAIVTYALFGMSGLDPLWDGELRAAFRNFPTSRILFIFDSCFAGGMTDLQEPGRILLMAAGEKGYAYEGAEWGGHGEFTYYLLGGMEGAANLYDYGAGILGVPGQVTAEEAFDFAKTSCTADAPVIADGFPGDMLL